MTRRSRLYCARPPARLQIFPIFELQEASPLQTDAASGLLKRGKSSATDAAYFIDDVARLWPGPLYADVSRVESVAPRAAWWHLLAALNGLRTAPIQLMPVMVPQDTRSELATAAPLAASSGRGALRIRMSQLQPMPSWVGSVVATTAAGLGISIGALDVILDWEDSLENMALDDLEARTVDAIRSLGMPGDQVILAGTPNSASFVQTGDWSVVRREWWLWLRVRAKGYDISYGDYALYPPSSPAPVGPKYGHLRYSSNDRLYVHRRGVPPT
ncbi:MAG: beta family protein, partial [Demequina sp.]|uniref:beta family protein n=1 Tax=Demequina sp. TaxID=2050685 RepID=UPI003A8BBEF2